MSNAAAAGTRVATAIGAIKWILIAIAITGAVVSVMATALGSQGIAGSLTVVLAIVAGAAAWSLFLWVLFGWFEHTLLTLATIARNTSPVVVPTPYTGSEADRPVAP